MGKLKGTEEAPSSHSPTGLESTRTRMGNLETEFLVVMY